MKRLNICLWVSVSSLIVLSSSAFAEQYKNLTYNISSLLSR